MRLVYGAILQIIDEIVHPIGTLAELK